MFVLIVCLERLCKAIESMFWLAVPVIIGASIPTCICWTLHASGELETATLPSLSLPCAYTSSLWGTDSSTWREDGYTANGKREKQGCQLQHLHVEACFSSFLTCVRFIGLVPLQLRQWGCWLPFRGGPKVVYLWRSVKTSVSHLLFPFLYRGISVFAKCSPTMYVLSSSPCFPCPEFSKFSPSSIPSSIALAA